MRKQKSLTKVSDYIPNLPLVEACQPNESSEHPKTTENVEANNPVGGIPLCARTRLTLNLLLLPHYTLLNIWTHDNRTFLLCQKIFA